MESKEARIGKELERELRHDQKVHSLLLIINALLFYLIITYLLFY